jgi:peptide/nickel transport system permease protein
MTVRLPFVLTLVLRRVIIGLMTLAAVSVLIFFGTQLLPGDVAQAILGHQATKESVAALRRALELDRPLVERFVSWAARLLHGDLGTSLANGRPVGPMIAERLGNTLFLAGVTALIAVPTSIALGIASVIWRGSVFDRLLGAASLGLISLPEFFLGYALIFLFSVELGWVPSLSSVQATMPLSSRLFAILLPCLTLALIVSAHMIRMTKVAVINVLDAPYVEMARLKGLSVARVVGVHALANAISPIVTVVVINLAYLVAGIVVVEVVFVYPGMGQLIVDSVAKRDIPVVQACAIIFGSSYIGLNILADVIALVANPRLRFPR